MTFPSTRSALAGLLAAAALTASPCLSAQPTAETTSRLVIRYKATASAATAAELHSAAGVARIAAAADKATAALAQRAAVSMKTVRVAGELGRNTVVRLDRELPLDEALALARRLQRDEGVESVSVDLKVRASQRTPAFPTDPHASALWPLAAPGFTPPGSPGTLGVGSARFVPAWQYATGRNVVVAVIDTGLAPHSDLAGQVVGGHDFVSSTDMARDGDGRDTDYADPGDACTRANPECGGATYASSWHGTMVAGLIAAHAGNGNAVAGAAPDVKLVVARGLGAGGGYLSDIADALLWSAGVPVVGVPANANPARVINLSLGSTVGVACQRFMQDAVVQARGRGAVVLAAAGNDGQASDYLGGIGSPANCNGVIAVAAHTKSGDRAAYSNWGGSVAFTAPGGGSCARHTAGCQADADLATWNSGSDAPQGEAVGAFVGTSAATPYAAAAAALLLSARPGMSPDEVKSALVTASAANAHAADSWCAQAVNAGLCGAGMLDAHGAVHAVASAMAPAVSIDPMARDWVATGSRVTLRARGQAAAGRNLAYAWRQVSGAAAAAVPGAAGELEVSLSPQAGDYLFEVTVTDDFGLSAKAQARLRANTVPGLAPLADVLAYAGQALQVGATGSDPERDTLTYALEAAPSGMVIGRDTGLIRWTAAGAGTYPVTVSVTDGFDGSLAQRTFSVTVVAPAVQAPSGDPSRPSPADGLPAASRPTAIVVAELLVPPEASGQSLGTLTIRPTEGLRVMLRRADAASNTFTYSLKGGKPGMTLDPVTGEFLWDANVEPGEHVVTVEIRQTTNGGQSKSTGSDAVVSFNVQVGPAAAPRPAAGVSASPLAGSGGGGAVGLLGLVLLAAAGMAAPRFAPVKR